MIKNHFKKRPTEAWIGGITAGMGLWIVVPMVAMGSTGYLYLLHMQPEFYWGIVFLTVGLAHFISVGVNGWRWWTPLTRAAASLIMTVLYGSWVYGFWVVAPGSTAVFMYGALCVASSRCLILALYDVAEKIGEARGVHT